MKITAAIAWEPGAPLSIEKVDLDERSGTGPVPAYGAAVGAGGTAVALLAGPSSSR